VVVDQVTWCKLGTEFFDQAVDVGLSDAAVRTHAEAIAWLYGLDREDVTDLSIPKHLVRRFAGSPDYEVGVEQLVSIGWWIETSTSYVVVHHGDVVRSSLAAQRKHREDEKERQRRKRAAAVKAPGVAPNVGTNVSATQTDRQTSKQALQDDRGEDVPADVDLSTGEVLEDRRSLSVVADAPAAVGEFCSEFVAGNKRCPDPPSGWESGRAFCAVHLEARTA
jgi:hypothetical protein